MKALGWVVAAALAGALAAGLAMRQERAAPLLRAQPGEPVGPLFVEVEEGDRLRLDLGFDLSSAAETAWGERAFGLSGDECPFGRLEPRGSLTPPTGDAHLVLTVELGAPERHAANLASCEYALGPGGPSAFLRLRGCFRAMILSIPTAREIVLRPLAAQSCEGS